jgi:hypothetical protein
MFSPFHISPLEIPYPIPPAPASMRVLLHSPTPILLPWHYPTLGIEHPQARGPLLLQMTNKAILCHICGQRHGSLHVYSLVGGPVPGSSGGGGGVWLLDTIAPSMGLQIPSAPSVLSPSPPSGTPELSSMVGWELPPVVVRLWQSLSGNNHIRLPSASTFLQSQ